MDSAARYEPLLGLDKLRTFQVWRDYLLAILLIIAALALSLAFLRLWPTTPDEEKNHGWSNDRLRSLSRP